MNKLLQFLFLCLFGTTLFAQTKTAPSDFVLARLKYYGGGDWYNDPSSIPNLLQFMAYNSNSAVGNTEAVVEIMDEYLGSKLSLLNS